ncbi:MAG: rhodanese-related sulfurtransferase [Chitinophagales bacterium]
MPEEKMEAFKEALSSCFAKYSTKYSSREQGYFFYKLVVKNRAKILADGLEDETFDVSNKGLHLKAEEFNEMMQKENTILIDMRNHYETEVGHFKGAITPDVDNFRESLPFIEDKILKGNEDKNILMYCTGGIRCEKASAWYKHRGFKNVYQLEGGIIKYAHEISEKKLPNLFVGKNFVFDERLEETISPEVIANCHTCGNPFDIHTNCANVACNVLFIQCDSCKEKLHNCCSEECKEIAALPEEVQKELRKGRKSQRNVFKKGRSEKLLFKK